MKNIKIKNKFIELEISEGSLLKNALKDAIEFCLKNKPEKCNLYFQGFIFDIRPGTNVDTKVLEFENWQKKRHVSIYKRTIDAILNKKNVVVKSDDGKQYKLSNQLKDEVGICVGCAFDEDVNPRLIYMCEEHGAVCDKPNKKMKVFKEYKGINNEKYN